jgi:4-amino-4-deoxy-L-arabinose transferase-like glycosyltransferase
MTKRDWIALAAVLLIGLGLRAPIAGIFLERDEGGYAYIAQRWLQGEVPYKHSFDQKPPGVYAAYAVIQRVFGGSQSAIHWGAQFYTLLTLAVVFLIGRRLFGMEAGFASGAFAALLTSHHSLLGNSANAETFMLLPLAAGFLCILLARDRVSLRWAAAGGAAAGLSLLFKQVALTDAVFYLAYLLLAPGLRRKALGAAAFIGAAAAVWAPVIAYFCVRGAGKEFYDCVIGYNLTYAGGIPLSDYGRNFWTTFSRTLPGLWPVYLLALAAALRRSSSWVLAWLAASFLGACVGGYFRGHYYLQAVPALAVLAGSAVASLSRRWSLPRSAAHAAAAGVVLYGALGALWYYGPGSAVSKTARLYAGNPFPEATGVAHFVAERTAPGDSVFVFGSEPEILYFAGRRSATRYIYLYPLLLPSPDAAARQEELLAQVREARPKVVVTVFARLSFLRAPGAPALVFDGVKDLLKDYRISAVVLSNPRNPTELIVGEGAQELWNEFPMWYDRPFWGTMAVWERRG